MKQTNTEESFLFAKKNKVSIWASNHPYADIPEEYFEETFSKNNTRAKNTWSSNFKIRYFRPEDLETNGSHEGLMELKQAAGECSFSSSFIAALMSKAKKKNLLQISWIILLFEYEYSSKATGVKSDDYVTLLGAFNYDDDADSLIEIAEPAEEDG
ncbi:MAG: immunity 22 family protein [Kangiellaceae bacterium]|nr:immunity 22 family protein [Kangiellaceae bacterium]